MKLNLRKRDDNGKVNIGVAIYQSDKEAFDKIADDLGITTSILLRSIINDVIDGNITVEI